MQTAVIAPARTITKPPLTRNQIRSFWAAWGGWTMDGMDSFIYSLVLVPALTDLLPKSGIRATSANVGYYGGLLFALFMVGWGAALIWGPIADRFGRVRGLAFYGGRSFSSDKKSWREAHSSRGAFPRALRLRVSSANECSPQFAPRRFLFFAVVPSKRFSRPG